MIGWDLCPWAARAWNDGQVAQRVFTGRRARRRARGGAFIDELGAKPDAADRPGDLSARRPARSARGRGSPNASAAPRREFLAAAFHPDYAPRRGRRARSARLVAVHPPHARSDAAVRARLAARRPARSDLRRRRARQPRHRQDARPGGPRRAADRHPPRSRRQLRARERTTLGAHACRSGVGSFFLNYRPIQTAVPRSPATIVPDRLDEQRANVSPRSGAIGRRKFAPLIARI